MPAHPPGDLPADPGALVSALTVNGEARPDPYPYYRRLRQLAPVYRGDWGLVLSRYDDCLRALRDHRLGKGFEMAPSGPGANPAGRGEGAGDPREGAHRPVASMLHLDPPEHTRQRRLVSRAFTPQRVEALRPAVTSIVEELVDRLAEARQADVMTELAFPLPVTVIGELLGVPPADRAGFQPLVRDAAATLEVVVDDQTMARAAQAEATMAAYFRDLMAERRAHPQDDLVTALAQARDRDDALTEAEVIATAILLFGAGFETTTNLIGNGLLALLRHPDQMARLGPDPGPGMLASAVEELLRWDSPVQLDGRVALEEVEVAGHLVPSGALVLTLIGGANRDPGRFAHPETLDVLRADNGPLSFGAGIHHCLGFALARLEGQVALGALVRRFAAMELMVDEPEWRPGLTLRGLARLPVQVTAR